MDRILTLPERKAAEAEKRCRAVEELRSVLAAYARAHGGRFLLFGSAARGEMRYDSDVDIMVDFPPEALDEDARLAADRPFFSLPSCVPLIAPASSATSRSAPTTASIRMTPSPRDGQRNT